LKIRGPTARPIAVVDRIPEEGRSEEQREQQRSVQAAGVRDGTGREKQRVARKKRRDDEASLREDDAEEQPVDPGPIRIDQLGQMSVEVEDEVDEG
jgi:hypothetical protein